MLESTFDITEWRMEVERVLPALKIFTRPDNKVVCARMRVCVCAQACVCVQACVWCVYARVRL